MITIIRHALAVRDAQTFDLVLQRAATIIYVADDELICSATRVHSSMRIAVHVQRDC